MLLNNAPFTNLIDLILITKFILFNPLDYKCDWSHSHHKIPANLKNSKNYNFKVLKNDNLYTWKKGLWRAKEKDNMRVRNQGYFYPLKDIFMFINIIKITLIFWLISFRFLWYIMQLFFVFHIFLSLYYKQTPLQIMISLNWFEFFSIKTYSLIIIILVFSLIEFWASSSLIDDDIKKSVWRKSFMSLLPLVLLLQSSIHIQVIFIPIAFTFLCIYIYIYKLLSDLKLFRLALLVLGRSHIYILLNLSIWFCKIIW